MCVHAAGESSPGDLPGDTHAIVLAAKGETHLEAIRAKLEEAGIPHTAIREPDTPWNGALMAIGLRPGKKEVLKRYLSSLPLLK